MSDQDRKARDDKAAQDWFASTDALLDSIMDKMLEQEFFRLASPEERLVMMEAQMHWLVKEFFRPMHKGMQENQLTPEEEKAWLMSLKETKELSSGGKGLFFDPKQGKSSRER